MADAAGTAASLSTSGRHCHQHGSVWSWTSRGYAKPKPVQLLSISQHVPLQSIAFAPPAVDAPVVRQQQQHQPQPPALLPYRVADQQINELVVLRHQQQQGQQQQQQQQQQLERLLHVDEATEQEQPQPLLRLIAAAQQRLQLEEADTQLLLLQLQPLFSTLPAEQLAQAAWAASYLPGGHSIASQPQWQQQLLAAAKQHYVRGTMQDATAAKLLQALVHLGVQPDKAWLEAACAGMPVANWHNARSLSIVAACLPQLGHAPGAGWAQAFFAASAARLLTFPPTSLARMLHGVVAWGQVQRQQQLQEHEREAGAAAAVWLQPPVQWLRAVLQRLHERSRGLKPPEIAMVLQALQRLQQQAASSSSSGSSRIDRLVLPPMGQRPCCKLQVDAQCLLHSLIPAVLQQLPSFRSLDLAVVLHSLAQLQLQQQQVADDDAPVGVDVGQGQMEPQQLCSWPWLQQVFRAAEEHLADSDARTQVTMLWAAANLIRPHVQHQQHQQDQQQQQQDQQQQQQGMFSQGLAAGNSPVATGTAAASGARAAYTVEMQAVSAGPGRPPMMRPVRITAPPQPPGTEQPAPTGLAQVHHTDGSPADTSSSNTTGDRSGAAPVPTAGSYWQAWLGAFHEASLPLLLHSFSCEDLVQAATTLAWQQQVPSAAWYEVLLAAVQQRLPGMSVGQVSGVAWALAQMSLLPCQHDPRMSLVPLQPWLQRLYSHTGLAPAAASSANGDDGSDGSSGPAAPAADAQMPGKLKQQQQRQCSPAELVRLMWAAGVCDFDPGDAWWWAAEQQMLADAAAAVDAARNAATTNHSSDALDAGRRQQGAAAATGAGEPRPLLVPLRLLGALFQAYAAAGRRIPPQLLQEVLLQDRVVQELPCMPVISVVKLLRAVARAQAVVPKPWLLRLAAGLQPQLLQLQPAELPQLLMCLAGAGLTLQDLITGPHGVSWLADCMRSCGQLLPRMSAQDCASMLWVAAKLRLPLPPALVQVLLMQLQRHFLKASPSALAQALDATSRLGHQPSGDWLGAFLMATHRRFTAAAAAAAAVAAAAGGLDAGSPGLSISSISGSIRSRLVLVQAILQTLQGLGRLKVPVAPKWLKHQLLLLHGQLPVLQPRHIATLMLVLAKLGCRPSPAYLQVMLQQLGDCRGCSAMALVHVLYGCASLRWQPSKVWMRVYLAAAVDQLPVMTPQNLALLHWSLGVVRVVPPLAWRRRAMAAVAARVGQLDALQLSMICWAWGRMRVYLTPIRAHQLRRLHRLRRQRTLRSQQAASSSVRGSGKGEVDAGAGAEQLMMPGGGFKPAKGQASTHHLAQRLLSRARQLRGQFSAPALVHLLVGVAKMQLVPSQVWLHGMVAHGSSDKLSVLDGYQMQQLLWALAQLGYVAHPSWVQGMGQLLDTKWQQQDSTRHSAAWALQQLHRRTAVVLAAGVGDGPRQQRSVQQ